MVVVCGWISCVSFNFKPKKEKKNDRSGNLISQVHSRGVKWVNLGWTYQYVKFI